MIYWKDVNPNKNPIQTRRLYQYYVEEYYNNKPIYYITCGGYCTDNKDVVLFVPFNIEKYIADKSYQHWKTIKLHSYDAKERCIRILKYRILDYFPYNPNKKGKQSKYRYDNKN